MGKLKAVNMTIPNDIELEIKRVTDENNIYEISMRLYYDSEVHESVVNNRWGLYSILRMYVKKPDRLYSDNGNEISLYTETPKKYLDIIHSIIYMLLPFYNANQNKVEEAIYEGNVVSEVREITFYVLDDE